MSPKIHVHLKPVNVMSFGNRAFAEVIKFRWYYIELLQTVNPIRLVSEREEMPVQTQRENAM